MIVSRSPTVRPDPSSTTSPSCHAARKRASLKRAVARSVMVGGYLIPRALARSSTLTLNVTEVDHGARLGENADNLLPDIALPVASLCKLCSCNSDRLIPMGSSKRHSDQPVGCFVRIGVGHLRKIDFM